MGIHKLEIELSDELMQAVGRLSVEQKLSPSDVVVATLKDHLPREQDNSLKENTISARLDALDQAFKIADTLGGSRTQEDIDRHVREFRADRTYGR